MKSDKRLSAWLISILLLGFLTRIFFLNPPLLERAPNRQMIDADIVRDLYRLGFRGMNRYLYGLPIYHQVVVEVYKLVGEIQEVWGKVISALLSIVTGFYFFKLVKLYTNKTQALAALYFFYLLSPMHIILARSFMIEEFTLMLAMVGFYCLAQKRFWLGSVFFSLMLLSKITYGYLLLPALFLLINFDQVLLFLALVLGPSVIWYKYAGNINQALGLNTGWDINFWFDSKLLISKDYYSKLIFNFVKDAVTPIGAVLASWGLLIKNDIKKYQLFYWWFLGALAYVLLVNNGAYYQGYYLFGLVAPTAFFASRAVGQLNGWWQKQDFIIPRQWVLILLAGACLTAVVNDGFMDAYKPVYNNHKQVLLAVKIAQNFIPKEAKVIGTAYTSTVLNYYIDRDFNELRITRLSDEQALAAFKKLSQDADYYLIYDKNELNGKPEFKKGLEDFKIVFSDPGLNLLIYKL